MRYVISGYDRSSFVSEELLLLIIEQSHSELLRLFAQTEALEVTAEILEYRTFLSSISAWASANKMPRACDQAEYRDWYWETRQYSDDRFEQGTNKIPPNEADKCKSIRLSFFKEIRLAHMLFVDWSKLVDIYLKNDPPIGYLEHLLAASQAPIPQTYTGQLWGSQLGSIVRRAVLVPIVHQFLCRWRRRHHLIDSLEAMLSIVDGQKLCISPPLLVQTETTAWWEFITDGSAEGRDRFRLYDRNIDAYVRDRLCNLACRTTSISDLTQQLWRLAA